MAEIGYARAIFGGGRKVWGKAVYETLVVALVSLLPLLLAAFRETLPVDSKQYLVGAFGKAFLSGQLLFDAMGLVATVVWQSNKDFKSFFPLRMLINLVCLIEVVICSVLIGFDPTLEFTSKSVVAGYSIVLFLVAVGLYTLMAIIAEVHVNVGKSLAQADANLGEGVRKSRGLE